MNRLTDGFTGTGSSATAAGLYTILLKIGIVSVTGPRIEIGFGVIVRPLILVLDEKGNRSSKSDSMLETRLKMDKVLLVSLRGTNCISRPSWSRGCKSYGSCEVALAWPSTAELELDVLG
jgi:hypothetical protein